MKVKGTTVRVFLSLLLLASSVAVAGVNDPPVVSIPVGATRVFTGAQPLGSGGGPLTPPQDYISDEQREEMRKVVEANIAQLGKEGKLAPLTPAVHPLYIWPLRLASGLTDPEYHGISNFVDLDPAFPNSLLDYNCGNRTYDRSDGYNHAGTDFYTWPWGWLKMDRGEVEIVAVAPGQIIYRNDGMFDRSCGFNNDNWNAILVQHADGSRVWYGHMKNGSVTPKQVGDMVVQGEYLGVVGSSGNSTGPHLHLETYDSLGHLIEPWAGVCNNLNSESWWQSQRAYFDSGVNRMTTGDAQAVFPVCPDPETPNMKATFPTNSQIYFTTYYRDQLLTHLSTYTIYRPDGTVWSQWTHSSPGSFSSSWWWWTFTFSAIEPQGTWRFTVEYLGTTHERFFAIGSPAACASLPEKPGQGELLKVNKNSTLLRLTWGPSCNPPDTDYVIYDGAIGTFYSHTKLVCSTGGNRVANIAPAASSRYYLVGPRNATREGSLGRSPAGVERPVGISACFPRAIIDCP
jgi:murein DD-endopeptidase MepM/ murein hydrolase activator NlpD